MSSSPFKINKRIPCSILSNITRCNQPNDRLKLVIYHKSKQAQSIVMNNSLTHILWIYLSRRRL